MRSTLILVAVAAAGFVATPALAQDMPGMVDWSAMTRATTSSTIDNLTVEEVARQEQAQSRRAQNRRSVSRARARTSTRKRDAETAAACKQSTPILLKMGLDPHPDCL